MTNFRESLVIHLLRFTAFLCITIHRLYGATLHQSQHYNTFGNRKVIVVCKGLRIQLGQFNVCHTCGSVFDMEKGRTEEDEAEDG